MAVDGAPMSQLDYRPSWLTRLGLTLTFIAILGTGIVLSAVFVALFLTLALVVGGWLWWQGRRLQRQMQEQFIKADYSVESDYRIIEGEYQLLEDHRAQDTPVDLRKPQD